MTLIAKFVLMILAIFSGIVSGHLNESGDKLKSGIADLIAAALGTLAILVK